MNRPGLFVTVDGPGGVGKSTTIAAVADVLRAHDLDVHTTCEPSRTRLGELIRASTDTYRGVALAHLVAGDRHHHLTNEIHPALRAGAVVVCDRYVASSLVLQRIDGLSEEEIWQINAGMDRPDLALILTAAPEVIAGRLAARGEPHSRFERHPRIAHLECDYYRQATARLSAAGWPVHTVECTTAAPAEVARMVTDHILHHVHPPEIP